MFKKSERLNRVEFNFYFQKGKKQHFPDYLIITYPSSITKIAVVVGKKVSKKAVTRNRFRRRVYGTLYRLLNNSRQTGIIIVIIKPSFKNLTRAIADVMLTKSIAQVIKNA